MKNRAAFTFVLQTIVATSRPQWSPFLWLSWSRSFEFDWLKDVEWPALLERTALMTGRNFCIHLLRRSPSLLLECQSDWSELLNIQKRLANSYIHFPNNDISEAFKEQEIDPTFKRNKKKRILTMRLAFRWICKFHRILQCSKHIPGRFCHVSRKVNSVNRRRYVVSSLHTLSNLDFSSYTANWTVLNYEKYSWSSFHYLDLHHSR